MGRPKGSTNKVVAVAEPEVVETPELKVETDGSVDLGDVDIRNVAVQSRKRVSLTNPDFDPFTKFKTEKGMYYRAINMKPHNVRKREAEGYKTIPGSEYGDLILAKLPKDIRVEREDYVKEKTMSQTRAAVEKFKEDSAKSGIKAYEEK